MTSEKRRRLFILSLGISCAIHSAAIFIYHEFPFVLQPSSNSPFKTNPHPEVVVIDDLKRQAYLEEMFEQVAMLSAPEKSFDPRFLPLKDPTLAATPHIEEIYSSDSVFEILTGPDFTPRSSSLSFVIPKDMPVEISSEETLEPLLRVLELDKELSTSIEKNPFLSHLIFEKEQKDPTYFVHREAKREKSDTPFPFCPAEQVKDLKINKEMFLPRVPFLETMQSRFLLVAPKMLDDTLENQIKNILAQDGTLPDAGNYSILEALPPVKSKEIVDLDVRLLPYEKEGYCGFLFSVSLTPHFTGCLKQNFYFLIDASNSIEKHRFEVFKRAVLRSLGSIHCQDRFNIYVLDKKIRRLSDHLIHVTKNSVESAERFLDEQDPGGLFAAADAYALLNKICVDSCSDNEVHTVILITDGKTLLSSEKQRKMIRCLSEKNSGNLSIYAAAVGRENDLILLDMLSSANHGHLLYSETHAAFPRKLAKLVSSLKMPLATEMRLIATPAKDQGCLALYPLCSQLPILYNNQPYHLIGFMDQPMEFTLLLEGRRNCEWFSIEKKISFEHVKKALPTLEKEYILEKVHERYDLYLEGGSIAYLEEAKELLKPLGGQTALQ